MARRKITSIGHTEYVDFPAQGITNVLAKVDTGADSSAIWASEVVENNGELSFVLFDETSRYYTGERITTTDYIVVSVKNAFGHTEKRFKTELSMRLGGRLIRTSFSLANRSRNRYPILIGKSTIRGKFLVDVGSPVKRRANKTRLLMLSSNPSSPAAKTLHERLTHDLKAADEVVLSGYNSLVFVAKEGKLHVTDTTSGHDLAGFGVVYFRTYAKYAEIAASAAEYLAARRVMFVDGEVGQYHSLSKLSQYVKLTLAGLPVPDYVFASHEYLLANYQQVVETVGEPFVLKDVNADRGQNNHLVHNEREYKACLKAQPGTMYIAQRFIPNEGDMRILVLRGKTPVVMFRRAAQDSHLNNVSQGGSAELLDAKKIDPVLRSASMRAAMVMNRHVAGVDIIIDTKTNAWYILEVNNSPQISSGTFIEEKIKALAKYLKQLQ